MKKKVFKKNRLVILALSVLIGVAGYLNFNSSKQDELLKETSDENNTDVEVISYDDSDAEASDEEAMEDLTDATYLEEAALTENVELNSDEEDIGEAVLTSAEVIKSNLATAKLNREQSRSKTKEALLDIINDDTMDSEEKAEAVSSYVALTDNIEKETAAETGLTAKGYEDAIVTVSSDSVDVTLSVSSLTDTERAQIEDVVTRKTGYDVSQIVISVASEK